MTREANLLSQKDLDRFVLQFYSLASAATSTLPISHRIIVESIYCSKITTLGRVDLDSKALISDAEIPILLSVKFYFQGRRHGVAQPNPLETL